MGFIVSTPTYFYQSPSGYIFRIRVPNDTLPKKNIDIGK